jgi:hypothetical protein
MSAAELSQVSSMNLLTSQQLVDLFTWQVNPKVQVPFPTKPRLGGTLFVSSSFAVLSTPLHRKTSSLQIVIQ